MAATKPRANAGVSRIDQPSRRTYGFFVRLARKGKIYNAFFADKSHGGKKKALLAARKHYQKLLRQHGRISRKDWAQVVRRKGRSGIVGVRRLAIKSGKKTLWAWVAAWSPRRGEVRRRMFAEKKFGARQAKELAIKTRRAGVRKMED